MREMILSRVADIKRMAIATRELHSIELGCIASALRHAAQEVEHEAAIRSATVEVTRR